MAFLPSIALAGEAASETMWLIGPYGFWWAVCVAGAVLALYQAWQFFQWMESQPAGSP